MVGGLFFLIWLNTHAGGDCKEMTSWTLYASYNNVFGMTFDEFLSECVSSTHKKWLLCNEYIFIQFFVDEE
jgi:hypothetical protein